MKNYLEDEIIDVPWDLQYPVPMEYRHWKRSLNPLLFTKAFSVRAYMLKPRNDQFNDLQHFPKDKFTFMLFNDTLKTWYLFCAAYTLV